MKLKCDLCGTYTLLWDDKLGPHLMSGSGRQCGSTKAEDLTDKRLWYLYVLALEDGCYYVGISRNVARRYTQHCGEVEGGANFTKLHRPVRIVETRCSGSSKKRVAVMQECKLTIQYAAKYGADKVRGGKYWTTAKLERKVRALA